MSVQDLLNYDAIQGGKDTSGFSADQNGNVIEILKYLIANAAAGDPMPPIISPYIEQACGGILSRDFLASASFGPPTSATWTANQMNGYPVVVTRGITIRKLYSANGATASGNIDVGVYDESYNKVISSGSTAQAGAGALQEFDVADTPISAGLYYVVFALDNATGTVYRSESISTPFHNLLGGIRQSSAFALPATLAPTAVPSSVPFIGFSTRTLVA